MSDMTDEELLAEEYICNGKCQDNITRNYVHCKICTRLKDFLAGLKTGRASQWHDLRKNPDDLPEDGAVVLANNILTTECIKFKKEKDGNHWRHDNFELCDVVYWKEIMLPEEADK